jgi:hypothetical protein
MYAGRKLRAIYNVRGKEATRNLYLEGLTEHIIRFNARILYSVSFNWLLLNIITLFVVIILKWPLNLTFVKKILIFRHFYCFFLNVIFWICLRSTFLDGADRLSRNVGD